MLTCSLWGYTYSPQSCLPFSLLSNVLLIFIPLVHYWWSSPSQHLFSSFSSVFWLLVTPLSPRSHYCTWHEPLLHILPQTAPFPKIISSFIYMESKLPVPHNNLMVFLSCLFPCQNCFVCLLLYFIPQINVTSIRLIFLPATCCKKSKSICCAQVSKAERQQIDIFSLYLLGRDWKSEIQIVLWCVMYLRGTCDIWPLYKYITFLKVW